MELVCTATACNNTALTPGTIAMLRSTQHAARRTAEPMSTIMQHLGIYTPTDRPSACAAAASSGWVVVCCCSSSIISMWCFLPLYAAVTAAPLAPLLCAVQQHSWAYLCNLPTSVAQSPNITLCQLPGFNSIRLVSAGTQQAHTNISANAQHDEAPSFLCAWLH
jgi:hypothetical protein